LPVKRQPFLRAVTQGSANIGKSWIISHPIFFRSSFVIANAQRTCPYAGLDTLTHLSQGSPRNLLAILKHIHRRALFAGEKPFSSGTISVESQSRGVMDSSAWFWEDAQPESDAQEVRDSICFIQDHSL
jgi:hypothetical protein